MKNNVRIAIVGSLIIFTVLFSHGQWSLKNVPSGGTIYSLAVKGEMIFAGTDNSSIFLSTDDGNSWTAANSGLTNSRVNAMVVSGANLFAAIDGEGVFRSGDDGATWTAVNTDMTDSWIFSLGVSGTNILAGSEGGRIWRSTNNGDNWATVTTGLSTENINALFESGTTLFAGSNGEGIIRSTDNGDSWTLINTGLVSTTVYCFAATGSNIYAGTSDGVYLSTDNGSQWNQVNNGLTNTYAFSLAAANTNLFVGTVFGGAFQSVDYASTWYDFSDGLPSGSWVRALAVTSSYLFSGNPDGVFRRPLSEVLPVELTEFAGSCRGALIELRWKTATETNNYGFGVEKMISGKWQPISFIEGAGTSSSVHEYSFVDHNISEGISSYRLRQEDRDGKTQYSHSINVHAEGVIKEFTLGQNYPNPFNPTTVISFTLPKESHITLKIYDCIGREVATLINDYRPAGQYQQRFDSHGLASGLYLYRIEIDSRSLVRSMMLMK